MADAFACADEHQAHPEKESSRDSCDLIETASFKLAANTATVSLPALVALFPLFIVLPVAPDLTPPTIGVSELVAAPPEVARTWHFVVRAAPPARAPALAS